MTEPLPDAVSTLDPLTMDPGAPPSTDHRDGDAGREPPSPKEPLSAPILLGRYVLLHEVGRGGMGVVHVAYDEKLERKVAIKLLRAQGDQAAQRRLVREAQGLARLSHPNVVQIYEIGDIEGQAFLAMEFIDGVTLRAWRAERPRSRAEILALFTAAGRGLAAAHEKGLVHRDFKPDNVMIRRDGQVLITDFGLVRRGEAAEEPIAPSAPEEARDDRTQIGVVMGTPGYMPPEQFSGRETDARGDQFSFCVALWEALCGERPFVGESRKEVEEAVLAGKLRGSPGGEIPAWLRETIVRGLACEPSDRWPTMGDLLAAIGRDPTPRRRVATAVVSVIALALTLTGVMTARQIRQRAAVVAECADEGRAIEADWSDAIAAATARVFLATGVESAAADFERTRPWMDAYQREWSTLTTRTCREARVEHTRDEASRAAIAACLEERRASFQGVLEAWAEMDASKLRFAVVQAAELPPLSLCTDEAHLGRLMRPPEPIRKEITDLRLQLARVRALRFGGDYTKAIERAEAMLLEAVKLGFLPLNAEVRLEIGQDQVELGRYDPSLSSVEQSFVDATTSGDELGMLFAATKQSHTLGSHRALFDQAHSWGKIALALLSRLKMEGSIAEGELRDSVGSVYLDEGVYESAIENYRRSLAIHEAKLGPQHPLTARSLNNLAAALRCQEKYAESLEPYQRALKIRETTLGPEHPAVAFSLTGLGLSTAALGDLEKARVYFERAIAIRERIGPPVGLAHSRFGLAKVLWSAGKHERAVELARAAQGAYREAGKGVEDDLARVEAWLRERSQ